MDADADAGIGAVLTVPLGAQKICSIAPGFILVVSLRRPPFSSLSQSDGNSNACHLLARAHSEWFSSASCWISPSSQYRGLSHLVIRSQPAEHEISIRQRLFQLISPSSRFIQESLPLLHYAPSFFRIRLRPDAEPWTLGSTPPVTATNQITSRALSSHRPIFRSGSLSFLFRHNG